MQVAPSWRGPFKRVPGHLFVFEVHTTACERLFSLGCVSHTDHRWAAGLGKEPDLFGRANSTILPELLAKDFVALRKRLDKFKPVPGNSAGKPAYEPRRFR